MDSNDPGVHPLHALAVYAESLAAGARVAVFGDASLGLGAKLAELGARAVHFWDPDADRARNEAGRAPRGVAVHAYDEQDADVRPIDLAIVSDLGLFDDASAIVRRVRRMVGEEGVAVIVAANAEAGHAPTTEPRSHSFDYYDLFDLVAPEFESVRMVAQLPFQGVALVELGEEDEAPGVNVDTQLGESGRAPMRSSWWLASVAHDSSRTRSSSSRRSRCPPNASTTTPLAIDAIERTSASPTAWPWTPRGRRTATLSCRHSCERSS